MCVCASNEPTRQSSSNDNNNCKNAHITLSMVLPCANCTDTLTQSRILKPVAFHSCILYNILNLDRRTSVRLTLTDGLVTDNLWNFQLDRSQFIFASRRQPGCWWLSIFSVQLTWPEWIELIFFTEIWTRPIPGLYERIDISFFHKNHSNEREHGGGWCRTHASCIPYIHFFLLFFASIWLW